VLDLDDADRADVFRTIVRGTLITLAVAILESVLLGTELIFFILFLWFGLRAMYIVAGRGKWKDRGWW